MTMAPARRPREARWAPGRPWTAPILVALGLLLGAVNVAVNHGLGPAPEHLSKIIGNDVGWLVAGFCACWSGRTWRGSMGRGLVLLVPAVMAYELLDHLVALRLDGVQTFTGPVTFMIFWSIAAVVASAALAGIVALIRRGGLLGVLAAAALPAFIARSAHGDHGHAADDPAMLEVTAILWPAAAAVTLAVLVVGVARHLLQRPSP